MLPCVKWSYWVFLVVVVIGCGRSNGRQEVTGTVTVGGKPLADGSISFMPQPGTSAPSTGGSIEQGKFMLTGPQGAMSGTYRVTVTTSRLTGITVKEPISEERTGEQDVFEFPDKLEATIEPAAKNHFDFQLEMTK